MHRRSTRTTIGLVRPAWAGAGRRWRLCVVVLALLLLPTPVPAEQRAIRGVVVDPSGLPVADARVEATPADGSATLTDREGRFTLRCDGPCPTAVRVMRSRFETVHVDVDAAQADRVRVVLPLARLSEQVRVAPPIVDGTTVDRFGSQGTVVSAAQIEQLHAIDLAAALRRTPGVTISRFNPVGAFGGEAGGAVFVRGTGASRPGSEIKVHVDGVPFYMGIWGHPLLDLLPVSSLEQVTVQKGPQPQAFGNAFSAIDLGTRRAHADGWRGSLRAAAGAFATLTEQADLAGRVGAWDLVVAQGAARSDGHRPGADGRLANVLGRVRFSSSPRWSVAATALHADNDAGDPGIDGRPDTRLGRFGTRGTLAMLTLTHDHERARGSLQAYVTRGQGHWRDQPALEGDTLTRFATVGARWREDVVWWDRGLVSGGIDVDRVDGAVQFDRVAPAPRARFDADALTLVSPHVGVSHILDVGRGWSVQPSAGVRRYAHSVFASATAPHAGVVVRGPRLVIVRVNAARGVNYPGQEVVALSRLVPPLGDTWRQLRPEVMDHVELGVAVAPRAGSSIDVALFHDRVRRRYVFAFPPVVARPSFTNLGAHTVRGLEAAVRQRLPAGWEAFVALTLLDASLSTLPYVPERALVAGLSGAFGPIRVTMDAQHQSGMTVLARARALAAVDAPTARVDGFTVVNVRPSWNVPGASGRAEVFVAIENLFDTRYAYRPGYPMPGTSAQVGITLRLQER